MNSRFFLALLLSTSSSIFYAPVIAAEAGAVNNDYPAPSEISPNPTYNTISKNEVGAIIDKIVTYTGVARSSFIARPSTRVTIAAARTERGQRYLLYDPVAMERVKRKGHSYWAVVGVIAHEIGHHLNGDTLDNQGSNHKKELDADEYSGSILQKMGATLEEAQEAINSIVLDVETLTHPAKQPRLLAVQSGWTKSLQLKNLPQPAIASSLLPSVHSEAITDRYEFKDDLVRDTKTGLIWMRCSLGQRWNGLMCAGGAEKYKWDQLATKGFNYAGYKDWRVPTISELKTLLYCSSGHPKKWNDTIHSCEGSYVRPAIATKAFPNLPQEGLFWTSSLGELGDSGAWTVDFIDGGERFEHKNNLYAVRLVRNDQEARRNTAQNRERNL